MSQIAAAPPEKPPQPTEYSIELYFDPALENQVLKAWNALARRHITTHLIDISSRPHLTLLAFSSLDFHRLLSPLRSLSSRLDPLPLSLSSIAAFPSSSSAAGSGGVLFLSPTPSAALLGVHAQLCEVLKKEGVEIPEGFKPDAWVPHCDVGQDVPKSRIGEAFCVLRDLKLPVSGYAVDIGLVELSSVREICSFPLGDGGAEI